MYVWMYVCMDVCMYVCMYVCIYIYIYIYACMWLNWLECAVADWQQPGPSSQSRSAGGPHT